MREILFRGKCKETGKWYIGNYINLHKTTYCFKEDYEADKDNDIHQIVFEKMTDWGLPNRHLRVDVIPETIGQYTGLTDKNGTRIFEGDIILWGLAPCVAKYEKENARFMFYENGKYLKNGFNIDTMKMKEVIGNIHDNPELLKSEVDTK